MMSTRIACLWIALAAILGIAVGGSLVGSFGGPYPHDSDHRGVQRSTDQEPYQHEVTKTLGETLSLIWGRTWDDPIAFYTFVLTVLTGLVGVVTLATFGIGVAQIRHGRRQFIAAHRPRMRVREFRMAGPGDGNVIRWTLSNVGGSTATIRGVLAATQLAVNDEDLPAPNYNRCQELITMQRFAPGNLDEQVTLPLQPNASDAARWLYVYGYVAYADELGNGFLTAFIRKWDWPRGRFTPVNDADYEHED